MDLYYIFKRWFKAQYGHLGFTVSNCYSGSDLIFRIDILQYNEITRLNNLNLEKIMDFTAGNSDLRKMLFDALFRQYGYRLDGDFTPTKQVKEFKL